MVQILVKIKEIFIYLTIKIINKKTIRHKIQTHTHKLPNIVFRLQKKYIFAKYND